MKKNIIFLGTLLLGSVAYSQVGINNEAPKATLDVTAKTTDGTKPEGIIAPRLTGDQIKSADTQYNTAQIGTIVYATTAVGTSTPKTVNITSPGYYYFDNTLVWVKFGSGSAALSTEPWYIQNTSTGATANNQNIYQQGKVAVGFTNTDAVSGKQFEVKGDVKSVVNNAGTYSLLETNNMAFGLPVNMMVTSNNTDLTAATNFGSLSTSINEAALSGKGPTGVASVGADGGISGPLNGARAEMSASNNTTNIVNRIVLGSNGETEQTDRIILRSENTPAITATRVVVGSTEGVTFKYGNIVNPSGNYTFPQNNGTAGQVLVTNGAAPALMNGAQLSWQNVSTLTPEPWKIQTTTNNATLNTNNIYQQGKVSIGSTSATPVTTKQLEVVGDFKSEITSGAGVTGLEVNPALMPGASGAYWLNPTTGAVNTIVATGSDARATSSDPLTNKVSNFQVSPNAVNIYSKHNGEAKQSTLEVNGEQGMFALYANEHATNWGAMVKSDKTNGLLLYHAGSNASDNVNNNDRTQITVKKADGVTFQHFNNIGALTAIYRFPLTTGTAGQVMTQSGTDGRIVWTDASAIAQEPWRVQTTGAQATANNQDIYQVGNVSIGTQTPIAPFTSNSVTITPKLSVTGDVAATGSYYTTTGKYADYVFEDYFDGSSKINADYDFKSLAETAAYIKANKHLPGVTPIKDILKTENGYTVNLSELSIQQLEKIEELYLHTIEQQQEIAKQKTEINDLKSRMEKLEQLLVKENNNK